MKVKNILIAFAVLMAQSICAQKTVYIPDSWKYNDTTQEYTEDV